jgi:hypothetical protein
MDSDFEAPCPVMKDKVQRMDVLVWIVGCIVGLDLRGMLFPTLGTGLP